MPQRQKPRTGLIIRHVPHEGIASYREPIEAAGYALARIAETGGCADGMRDLHRRPVPPSPPRAVP